MFDIKKIKGYNNGWSRWQQPTMKAYLAQCCDCGLIHEMEFRALEKGKINKDKSWVAKPLDIRKYRVEFRARRYEQ